MKELTEKQRYWKEHLEAVEMFDGDIVAYARQHGLDAKSLYRYKTYLRQREEKQRAPSGFVKVKAPSKLVSESLTVILANGVQLNVESWNAPGLLEHLSKL